VDGSCPVCSCLVSRVTDRFVGLALIQSSSCCFYSASKWSTLQQFAARASTKLRFVQAPPPPTNKCRFHIIVSRQTLGMRVSPYNAIPKLHQVRCLRAYKVRSNTCSNYRFVFVIRELQSIAIRVSVCLSVCLCLSVRSYF